MLGRLLAVGAATSAIAVGTLLAAPPAEAMPPEKTVNCQHEHHIDFNSDGSVAWEGNITVCTWTYPSGATIEKTYDENGKLSEICTGRKGRIFQDCAPP